MDKLSKTEEEKIITRVRKRLGKLIKAEHENRPKMIEALKFSFLNEQWDPLKKKAREDLRQPAFVINLINKYIRQVTGDIRQNKPEGKIRPTTPDSDPQVAKVREGMIRGIQYKSDAKDIYVRASDYLTRCGYAAWRVITQYKSKESFEQEILIKDIENPFSVYLSPDKRYGFILEKFSKDDFERKYPDCEIPTEKDFEGAEGVALEHWWDGESVTVAEYFEIETETEEWALLSDGHSLRKKDADALLKMDQEASEGRAPDAPKVVPLSIARTKQVEIDKVVHYVVSGKDIISRENWDGERIPIIVAKGEVLNIEGKEYIHGMVHDAKDPQVLYNWLQSDIAHRISLTPKSQWQGTPEMFAGFEDDYVDANRLALPMLKYNHDPKRPNDKPNRVEAAPIPADLFMEGERVEKMVDGTLGMYRASVGREAGDQESGVLFAKKVRETDTGTFVYIDQLRKAIEETIEVLNDLLPKIHDTQQDVYARNIDETECFVPVNIPVGELVQAMQKDPSRYRGVDPTKVMMFQQTHGPQAIYNDLSKGKYEATIVVGPSYTTQRQEAGEKMMQFAAASGKMNPVDKYFVAKNMDFPGAEEYAEILKKMLPPGLLPPKPGDAPTPPLPPNPQQILAQLKMQTERAKQAVQLQKLKNEGGAAQTADIDLRATILSVIQEVLAEPGQHPADHAGA